MELREIISFFHVARLRSVSKAARKLELGQPTVTTHLRKLEDEFNITLFDRIKRPIQLTSEGATFLELITPIVECVDTLKTQMDYSERRGSFVVGAYPDLVMHHLPKPIQSFRARFPDVRLRLVARPYLTLIQLVKSGELDLALCSPPPPDDASLEFTGLFSCNVVLMTPPGHPLLKQQPIQLQDAASWPLILSGPESLTRRKVEQALKDQGISYEVVLEMDNTELIKQYVEIGLGVAIVSDFTLHEEDHDKIGVVRLDHIFPSADIGLCTLRGKFLGRAVRNFMDSLTESLSGIHPELADWEEAQLAADKLLAAGVAEP
jgi:LysR family transcriptional regulator, cys regulon transcriptional activator